jgi:hypothetical protein
VAAQIASLVAALLALDVALTFENVWPTPAIRWTAEGSVELAIAIIALDILIRRAPARARTIASWFGAVWLLLTLGRYADVTAPALYGRDVNLYWDLRFIPDVVKMVTTVTRAGLVVGAAAVVVAALAGLFVAFAAAWRVVARSLTSTRWRRALQTIACLALVGFISQAISEHAPELPKFASPVTVAYARQARFAFTALTAATYVPPSPPMDVALTGVRDADVFVVFVEAYGAVAYSRPEIASALKRAETTLQAAVDETHRGVVSAFVESPTFGGSSWLAHISLLTGIEVKDPDRNARLMTERRDTLPRTFSRNGFRTVALMPGLRIGWPEGAFYGFDEIYGADRLAYHGPEFGWFAIPDEYSLQRLDALEVAKQPRAPLFVFFPTISTHFPFNPIPPYQPDWSRMTDPHPYDGPSIVKAYGRELDWVNFTPVYADAIAYDLTTLAGYLRLRADRDVVLVIIGDHQPAAAVSGTHASWDVPVHVIANRSVVLDKLRTDGFVDGLMPQQTLGKMNELTAVLLDAFR